MYPLLSSSPSQAPLLTNTITPAARLCCAVVVIEARVNDLGYTKDLPSNAPRNHLLARAISPFNLPTYADLIGNTRSSYS